jgi:hypothetical protein
MSGLVYTLVTSFALAEPSVLYDSIGWSGSLSMYSHMSASIPFFVCCIRTPASNADRHDAGVA